MISKTELKKNYDSIQSKVRKLNPNICIIAVSKSQPIESIVSLYEMGQKDFGENYIQELHQKSLELEKRGIRDLRWHFIGHLQSNKINMALQHSYCVHTVDSPKLIKKISERASNNSLPVFIEVKLSDEKEKTGISEEALPAMADCVAEFKNIELLGLMTVPEMGLSAATLRRIFQRLKALEASLHPHSKGMLSMGMSHDFEIAIQEGATHVRIGTALFGERQNHSK